MAAGGLHPSPRRSGGGSENPYAVLLQALLDGQGSALSQEVDAFTYAEAVAESRALVGLFSTITRFRYQRDPDRMTDMLPRWEAILGLRPAADASDVARRTAVKVMRQRYGLAPTYVNVTTLLGALVPNYYVEIFSNDVTTARQTMPGGATLGPITVYDDPWASGIARVLVHLEPPPGTLDRDFYAAAAIITPLLDSFLPAWVDWQWFRAITTATTCVC